MQNCGRIVLPRTHSLTLSLTVASPSCLNHYRPIGWKWSQLPDSGCFAGRVYVRRPKYWKRGRYGETGTSPTRQAKADWRASKVQKSVAPISLATATCRTSRVRGWPDARHRPWTNSRRSAAKAEARRWICYGLCDGLLRVLLRVKCLIINTCYGVTAFPGGEGYASA